MCWFDDKISALSLSSSFFFFTNQLVLLSVVISLILSLAFILSAQTMHESLLTNVLRWAMMLFDTTPMGRILNRFSKDVDTVDNVLPQCLRAWLMTFFSVNFHPVPFVLFPFLLFLFYFDFNPIYANLIQSEISLWFYK